LILLAAIEEEGGVFCGSRPDNHNGTSTKRQLYLLSYRLTTKHSYIWVMGEMKKI